MRHFSNFFNTKVKEWSVFFILVFFLITVSLSSAVSKSFIDGVNLWFSSILPALFPYALLTTLLSGLNTINSLGKTFSPLTKRLFKVNGSLFYALFVAILSGHPTGVKAVCDLKKANVLTDDESVRASCLCAMSSPVFLISCIGNITFKNSLFGVILFVSNLLSAITIGLCFRLYKRKNLDDKAPLSPRILTIGFSDAVNSSVLSVLFAGGFIVVFYMLTELLALMGVFNPLIWLFELIFKDKTLAKGMVFGLFETTKGFKIISEVGANFMTLSICAFLTGFSGLSMVCQSVSFLKKEKIKIAPFILSRILSAILCVVYSLILGLLFFK